MRKFSGGGAPRPPPGLPPPGPPFLHPSHCARFARLRSWLVGAKLKKRKFFLMIPHGKMHGTPLSRSRKGIFRIHYLWLGSVVLRGRGSHRSRTPPPRTAQIFCPSPPPPGEISETEDLKPFRSGTRPPPPRRTPKTFSLSTPKNHFFKLFLLQNFPKSPNSTLFIKFVLKNSNFSQGSTGTRVPFPVPAGTPKPERAGTRNSSGQAGTGTDPTGTRNRNSKEKSRKFRKKYSFSCYFPAKKFLKISNFSYFAPYRDTWIRA